MPQLLLGGLPSLLAAAAAVTVLALTLTLALPVLWGGTPRPVEAAELAAQGSQSIGSWLVEADVTLLPALGYRFDIRLTRDLAAPPPDRLRPIVVIEMITMHSFEPPLVLMGAGEYQAEGILPMPGRWRFRVGFEEGSLDLTVNVPGVAGETT